MYKDNTTTIKKRASNLCLNLLNSTISHMSIITTPTITREIAIAINDKSKKSIKTFRDRYFLLSKNSSAFFVGILGCSEMLIHVLKDVVFTVHF